MTELVFEASDELKAIFEHTKNAKEWSNPYGLYPELESEMHIDFVKDQGIYIMSGNKETLKGEDTHNMIVYAEGYNPEINEDYWEESEYAVGGDDFAQGLPVSEEMCEKVMRGSAFLILVEGDSFRYGTVSR